MTTLLKSNNASTVLAAAISADATSLTVADASAFPTPVEGVSIFKLTLVDAATGTSTEIMHVTAVSDDVFTVVRAQEGTTARAWAVSDIVANMVTAGTLDFFAQLDSPVFTGNPEVPTQPAGTDNTTAASTEFVTTAITNITGRLLGAPKIFSSSGTYTWAATVKAVVVEVIGAGGAGGGTPATSASQNSVAAGGGGGAISIGYFQTSDITASVSVVVGSAGVGSAGATGAQGGSSSFGAYLIAGGGYGGIAGAAAGSSAPYVLQSVAGGVASNGTIINADGSPGGTAVFITLGAGISGMGANGPLGAGAGNGGSTQSGGFTAATGPGAGGGGSAVGPSAVAQAGGAGFKGMVRIWEFG